MKSRLAVLIPRLVFQLLMTAFTIYRAVQGRWVEALLIACFSEILNIRWKIDDWTERQKAHPILGGRG